MANTKATTGEPKQAPNNVVAIALGNALSKIDEKRQALIAEIARLDQSLSENRDKLSLDEKALSEAQKQLNILDQERIKVTKDVLSEQGIDLTPSRRQTKAVAGTRGRSKGKAASGKRTRMSTEFRDKKVEQALGYFNSGKTFSKDQLASKLKLTTVQVNTILKQIKGIKMHGSRRTATYGL